MGWRSVFFVSSVAKETSTPPFPEWLEPMAATLTQERFTGPDWIFERKYDGIRLIAFKRGTDVRLYSRNRLPQNIPGVTAAIAALPHQEIILDGEITWDPPSSEGSGGASPPSGCPRVDIL